VKRFLRLISVLLVSTSIGGCTSARQKIEEQQEIERRIRKTSNADEVKSCNFIMNLRPDGLHSTPEAQAASLLIPQEGVSWVVFGGSGNYELYSCSHKTLQNEQQAKAPRPTPVETKPKAGASVPVEAKAAPAQPEAKSEVITREQPEAKIRASDQAKERAHRTRVTNNPEAVKGCKFLESFVEYQKVFHFQEDVVRAGGNLGYIVATNQDGDVIGESYLCSEEAKP
jgi:hypothetical protein